MKQCPYCGEEIRDEAIKCKYCEEYLQNSSHKKTQDKSNNYVLSAIITPICVVLLHLNQSLYQFVIKHWLISIICFFLICIVIEKIVKTIKSSENQENK